MNEYLIDAERMKTKDEAHHYLQRLFAFPDYYGANPDALHDLLGEIGEETLLKVPRKLADEAYLSAYGAAMLQVFLAAAAENEFLTVQLV